MRAEYGKSAYLGGIAQREKQREDARNESKTQALWFEDKGKLDAKKEHEKDREDLQKRIECSQFNWTEIQRRKIDNKNATTTNKANDRFLEDQELN